MEQVTQARAAVQTVKKNLDTLMALQNKAFGQLGADQVKHVAPIQNDIKNVVKSIKKGDGDKLNEYLSKYADSINK